MTAVSSGPPNPDFTCDICCLMMSSASELATHKMAHDDNSTTCPICHKVFSSVSNRRCHLATHTNEKAYKCRFCPRKFNWKSQLATHEHIHTGQGLYYCPICGKPCMTKWLLVRHIEVHARAGETTQARKERTRVRKQSQQSPEQAQQPGDLDCSLNVESSLNNSSIDVTNCDEDKSIDISDRDEESKSDEGENQADDKPLACNNCNLTFTTQESLARHLLTHLVAKKHECTRCNLQFRTLSALRRHFKRTPECAEGSGVGDFLKPTQSVPEEMYISLQKRKCIEDSLRHTLAETFSPRNAFPASNEFSPVVPTQNTAPQPILVQPSSTPTSEQQYQSVVTSAQPTTMPSRNVMTSSAIPMTTPNVMTPSQPMVFPPPFAMLPQPFPHYMMSPVGPVPTGVVPILTHGRISFQRSPQPTAMDLSSVSSKTPGKLVKTVQPSEKDVVNIVPQAEPRQKNASIIAALNQPLSPRYADRAPSPIPSTDDDGAEGQLMIDLSSCETAVGAGDGILDLSTAGRKRKRSVEVSEPEEEAPPSKLTPPSRERKLSPSRELDENDNVPLQQRSNTVQTREDDATAVPIAMARQFQQLVDQVNSQHRHQMEVNARHMNLLQSEFEKVQREGESQLQHLNQRMTSLENLVVQQRDMFDRILRENPQLSVSILPTSTSPMAK